jgi:predicted protein tyrosine phosphatase
VKILFVCSRNRSRSLTAEHHLAGRPGLAVRSAGTAASARVRITAGHVGWADVVAVMERRHREQIAARFPNELAGKRVVCLDISDDYAYGDEDLLDLIEAGIEPLLEPEAAAAREASR